MPKDTQNVPITYPNQRMVTVHRIKPERDYLGIKNCNWMAAAKDLRPFAFTLYLYLAANADNYTFALSPAAIAADIGMPRSTYHDQFRVLVNKGYLVSSSGNGYDFYEVPQARDVQENLEKRSPYGLNFEDSTSDGKSVCQAVCNDTEVNTEINNNYINNNIDSESFRF